jgi:hypothetical protein
MESKLTLVGSAAQRVTPFLNRLDVCFALLSQVVICIPAAVAAWLLSILWPIGLFGVVVTFWFLMMFAAIVFLKVLRSCVPMKPGLYSYEDRNPVTYVWTLNSFICATNLGIIYNHPSLLPSPLKKIFYWSLGAKLGSGPMMLGGRLTDPHLITIEEGAVIGGDCWLLAHAMARFDKNVLILKPIIIRRDAIIGALSLVMPGVEVGEGAMLRAMSYVPMNTVIPAGETWGGAPATLRPARPSSN